MIAPAYSVASNAGLAGHFDPIYNHRECKWKATRAGWDRISKCDDGFLILQKRPQEDHFSESISPSLVKIGKDGERYDTVWILF